MLFSRRCHIIKFRILYRLAICRLHNFAPSKHGDYSHTKILKTLCEQITHTTWQTNEQHFKKTDKIFLTDAFLFKMLFVVCLMSVSQNTTTVRVFPNLIPVCIRL